jgi:hypothetical protein
VSQKSEHGSQESEYGSGTLFRAPDGAVYFIRDEVLSACRQPEEVAEKLVHNRAQATDFTFRAPVQEVLLRALTEDDYLERMLLDPVGALAGYELTAEEHAMLSAKAAAGQKANALGPLAYALEYDEADAHEMPRQPIEAGPDAIRELVERIRNTSGEAQWNQLRALLRVMRAARRG